MMRAAALGDGIEEIREVRWRPVRGSDAVHEHSASSGARQSWCLDGWGLAAELRWLSDDACCSLRAAASAATPIINCAAMLAQSILSICNNSFLFSSITPDIHVAFTSTISPALLRNLLAEHIVQHSLNGVTRSRTGVIW